MGIVLLAPDAKPVLPFHPTAGGGSAGNPRFLRYIPYQCRKRARIDDASAPSRKTDLEIKPHRRFLTRSKRCRRPRSTRRFGGGIGCRDIFSAGAPILFAY